MTKGLTFKEVSKLLKKEDGQLIEAVDQMLGLTLVCSPLILGPPALAALPLLRVKGELTALGKTFLSKLTKKKDLDFLARMHRIQMTYALICYTSFFDALDQLLPEELRNEIRLRPEEKKFIAEKAVVEKDSSRDRTAEPKETTGLSGHGIEFPHPAAPLGHVEKIRALHGRLTEGLLAFLRGLAVFENADDKVAAQLRAVEEELPKTAIVFFEGQFVELAREYQDFFLWNQIKDKQAMSANLLQVGGASSTFLNAYGGSKKFY